ncbi:MAG: hypothetical protein JW993_10085 [Sedimentisphaerales bacterium]|nr:hypothetical protein [Sedimentisphaerales bacterium]
MNTGRILGVFVVLALMATNGWGADIILNEYNAVDSNDFLNGGTSEADADGGRASDSYFGRVRGNGGDWFELVVIKDHLDIRGWHLDVLVDGILEEILDLTTDPIWSDLRSGTIITVAEDVPANVSYNPAAGDWWINVQANSDVQSPYISAQSFPVNNNNWQLRIRSTLGGLIFGPAGEGISPSGGVSDTEVFRLEASPSASVTSDSNDYDDGADFSTFGAPNRWGMQDFSDLRIAVPEAASLTLTTPQGPDSYPAGTGVVVRWETVGPVDSVLVEFSLDGGATWQEVHPPNVGNTGRYDWSIPPMIDSEHALIRISNADYLVVYDTSDEPFTITAN